MNNKKNIDVLLIGAGVMSTTLASLLKQLEPDWKIQILERLPHPALESTNALNNAGTGHSGFCELNYDLEKAIHTCESFEVSKQYWAFLAKFNLISNDFIHNVPHISFVEGEENVKELKQRYEEFKKVCLFEDMEFSDDINVINSWAPLLTEKRDPSKPIAATRVKRGTDVDFGKLTEELIKYITKYDVNIAYNEEVTSIKRHINSDYRSIWEVKVKNLETKEITTYYTKFLFIGAGGASLNLLEQSGIKESYGYGGFPVSGNWLICKNKEFIKKHSAKVYGKPSVGAPPMSVPHLDTRIINGEKCLIFGPYAGFSTKFLKNGSWLDFFKSIRPGNLYAIISSGITNLGLIKYLFTQVFKTKKGKFKTLLEYCPSANINDWEPYQAGQRVQVIKLEKGKGNIKFGTELVISEDKTLACMLGASPGASTSVQIMLDLFEKCFGHTKSWRDYLYKLNYMVPSYRSTLHDDKELFEEINEKSNIFLNLK